MSRKTVRRYLSTWRSLGRGLGFTLATLPIAVVSSVLLWTGVIVGLALVITWVGIPLLVGALYVARWFGDLELRRLEAAGRPVIARPDWKRASPERGSIRRMWNVLADGRYWVRAVHGGIVNLVVGTATWSIVVTWVAVSVGGVTFWFWDAWPGSDGWRMPVGPAAVLGIFGLVTLPLVVHAMVVVHDVVARVMLGEWRVTALRRIVAASEASRESAILAEDYSLRRLERDIHDGPQQSLLRIQYDLASAARGLGADHPSQPLVDGALELTKETLRELRQLSQGLAPPLLQDRGLTSAIVALAARSEIPTTTSVDLDQDDDAILEVERSVYFIIAELLSNTAKHARATKAHIEVGSSRNPTGKRVLRVRFVDDGVGGATFVTGHGLQGVHERVAGLRGTLVMNSPDGGPSDFEIAIPLSSSDAL